MMTNNGAPSLSLTSLSLSLTLVTFCPILFSFFKHQFVDKVMVLLSFLPTLFFIIIQSQVLLSHNLFHPLSAQIVVSVGEHVAAENVQTLALVCSAKWTAHSAADGVPPTQIESPGALAGIVCCS